MIAIESRDNLISASILGEFTLADYQEFEQHVLHSLKFVGGVYVLLDLRDMISYTVDVAWEDLRFVHAHKYDFRKIALVSHDQWHTWLAWVGQFFVDAEVQVFDDPQPALEWLQVPL